MGNQPSLKRTVGLAGAVTLGLGSIFGTGVFISLGLAVGVVGDWALIALIIAAILATCNALSSAQLATNHPVSGGTYAYGRHYISDEIGFTAGLSFLLAKSTSAAAAAIGVVSYGVHVLGLTVAVNIVAALVAIVMTALVLLGLKRANAVNTVLVGVTMVALITLIITAIGVDPKMPVSLSALHAPNLFEAAALIFVAFTGYGRIATLGEEITDPQRTIPRAIIITLILSTLIYGGVLWAGLSTIGAERYAALTAADASPLRNIALSMGVPYLAGFIAVAAVTAMAGVLLNLILGLSRVAFAMGRDRELPAILGRLNARQDPSIAVMAIGLFIACLGLFGGLTWVWSFSASTVLIYYGITNWAALRLSDEQRLYPRIISWVGLIGCLGLAVFIDWRVIITGTIILLIGLFIRQLVKAPR
ncbi:APC family permease [Fretibacter rubidus]|uniref:APC family permease n=1 Tax=Fretibacter rubidus TaxID=570162 RepID=UPI00352A2DEB